jgi:hypothetical protein
VSKRITITNDPEKYVSIAIDLEDPDEWVKEQPHRLELVWKFMLMIAEYEEEEVSYALACAFIGQELRRRGKLSFPVPQ